MPNILYVVATDLEYAVLKTDELFFCVTGIGQINTAMSLTEYLIQHPETNQVINLGIGGIGSDRETPLGELAIASEEWFADLGVESKHEILGLEEIGIPLVANQSKPWNRVPVSEELSSILSTKLKLKTLPFLTVNACTGTDSRSKLIGESDVPFVENMEGAAAALVCKTYGVEYVEIRGISNRVGVRNKSEWKIQEALQNLREQLSGINALMLESLNE